MTDPKINLTQEVLTLIAHVDEFKGKWEVLKTLTPERLTRLRKVATIESIGSSTRIEGAKLSDAQVETLLAELDTKSFSTRDEQEVAGYAQAMDLIYDAYADLHITENHIRQLHQVLLRHSVKDERHRGSYKTLDNHVVARGPDGIELGIVFETATPFDTPKRMADLVAWLNRATDERLMHPLMIVAVFIVVFLAIHPFQDGNGRLSRILTTLLLLRAGYSYVPFASLESIVEENKDLYYKALRRTQGTLKGETPDWEPWLGFFLNCLQKQTQNLSYRIENERAAADQVLGLLATKILTHLGEHDGLEIAKLHELTGANMSTLRLNLRELVQAGRIQRMGKGRATWYRLPR